MKDEAKIFDEYIDYKIKYERKRAIKSLFEIKSLDYLLTEKWYFITFYWFKTLVCLFLNRTTSFDYKTRTVEVSKFDEYQGYETTSWINCDVGYGIFKNWKISIYADGN